FMSDGDGGWTKVIDIAAYEGLENPDEGDPADGGVDSNPYSLTMDGIGGWVVSDAGGNDLLHIDAEGELSTLAVFPDQMVDAPPFLGLPEGAQVPMEAVPTGVVQGPDGAFYVGELTGFPFAPGMARVWRVTADGEMSVYADGFTNILDIAFDGSGNLFVLEGVAGGLLNADPSNPASAAAQIVMVAPDGTQTEVDSAGLVFATGIAIGHDGTIYVSNFGVMPMMGQIVAIEGVAEPFPTGPDLTVVASGLNNPRGIFVDDAGDVYVAQGGTAGETCQEAPGEDVEDPVEICFGYTGSIEIVTGETPLSAVTGISSLLDIRGDIVGVQDVAVDDEGLIYAVVGLGADPAARAEYPVEAGDLGWVISASAGSSGLLMVDIAAYETDNNPDGGALDSNPYSLVSDGVGGWVISDAGMNALLHVDSDGTISTLAVFEPRMVDAPPMLGLPEGAQVPMQAVPTGVVMGPDGAFYVGELTGFPFEQGAARVWRVTADGEASVYAEGFTNIVDLAFDSEGNLYVLELAKNSLLSEDVTSAVVQVLDDGGQLEVASAGLTFATGLAIGPDDTFYVSNFGVMPDMGQVVSFTLD
ncbi:MAG: ScyD/ScyE family protein, partial [Thermomicrobiales bacterium]